MSTFFHDLPVEPIIYIFSFLTPKTLFVVAQVCKLWKDAAGVDQLWRPICQSNRVDANLIGVKEATKYYKGQFVKWQSDYAGCTDVYPVIYDLYKTLQKWIDNSKIKIKLLPGVTQEKLKIATDKLREICKDPALAFPKDYSCWLMMTEGQDDSSPGLFGGYSFYQYKTDTRILSLKLMARLQASQFSLFPGLIPFAVSRGKMHFIVNNPNAQPGLKKYKRHQLVTSGNDCLFPLAESFTAFMKNHITNLETGNYGIVNGSIDLFPRNNIPTQTTNHVTISASPLFIAERSSPSEYLWAYSITMSMSPDVPKRFYDCQLESRHWDITSNGRTEVVDGNGVVGEYPRMFPGATFTYQSCCPLSVSTGTMGGSFQMRSLYNQSQFDVIVPTFTFRVPEMLIDDSGEKMETDKE